MTYDETEDSRVPVKRAMREIASHGSTGFVSGSGSFLLASYDDEEIAAIGADGCVCGRDVLDWLGY